MALDLDCNSTEYYIGDGGRIDYQFYFELIEDTDLRVAIYNTTTQKYEDTTAWSKPDSTPIVRFNTPPLHGERILIYRMTAFNPLKAIFHPGHPVKAGDLNDNFEQLQFALEDTKCWSGESNGVAIQPSEKAPVHVGANPPINPKQGDLWWSTIIANLFLWYVDGNSSQWVDASVTTGEGGGTSGPTTTINTIEPITSGYIPGANSYDIGFDISSLDIAPTTITIRR